MHKDKNIIDDASLQEFKCYSGRVAGIQEVLARDHMKVCIFSLHFKNDIDLLLKNEGNGFRNVIKCHILLYSISKS